MTKTIAIQLSNSDSFMITHQPKLLQNIIDHTKICELLCNNKPHLLLKGCSYKKDFHPSVGFGSSSDRASENSKTEKAFSREIQFNPCINKVMI